MATQSVFSGARALYAALLTGGENAGMMEGGMRREDADLFR